MAASLTPPPAARAFLDRNGWTGADIAPLACDASFRRYFRVTATDGARAVLMDAPPPHEDPRPFLAIAAHLRAHGFRAPAILAEDAGTGLVLLEDFGDARMREQVDAGDAAREAATYADAVTLLARLHRTPAAAVAPYDRAALHREVDLFVDWYAPAQGLTVDRAGWTAAWDDAFDALSQDAPVTVLRDYHAENIMLLPDGALGLLDFQDALAGHRAYDLVSLLQDARRDVAPAVEAAMRAHYATMAVTGDAFETDYAILGVQRNVKILGIFTRLWQRDGKPRYLQFLPRVWGYVDRGIGHPALAAVAAWFDANVPAAARGQADWSARA